MKFGQYAPNGCECNFMLSCAWKQEGKIVRSSYTATVVMSLNPKHIENLKFGAVFTPAVINLLIPSS